MTEYRPDIMIYHANCADGFGAAWAAWMRWGSAIEYVPCSYGQNPPDVRGKHVLIGDFSFKRSQLDAMLTEAASVVILDHHKTAEAELAPFVVDCGGWIWERIWSRACYAIWRNRTGRRASLHLTWNDLGRS